MATPPPLPPTVPSLEAPPPPTPALPPAPEPFVRDRVVVLGRTQAGKTVYIARLYHELWTKPQDWLTMRAISGVAHTALMTMCGDLASGRWPGATIGQRYVDCDLKFHSKLHRLTILDYPGEVFTKAFVRGESDSEDAASLLDHVDHAKGVILLIDPKNALESRDHTTRADDDFGMTAVVDRIRTYPGGEAVPIAIVLTKCDLHEAKILELGGLKVFISEYLHWITRTAGSHYKTFPCAAVRLTRESRTGNGAPSLVKSPINVIEPLIWILESLDSQIAKSQIAADSQAKSQSFNQTLAEVRDLIAQGVTNANCERAIRILADLTVEHHGDPRIQALRNEIEAARLDHEEHSEKRKTVFYLGFTVAMVVLLAGLVFALVHFLK